MAKLKKVAKLSDIKNGKAIICEVGNREVAIFKIEGKLYAIDNFCTHLGGPLGEGFVGKDRTVICPWHGWRFSLESGECLTNPDKDQKIYKIHVKNKDIFIEL